MGAVVTVGCKLPHGLVAQVGDQTITFKGLNSTQHGDGETLILFNHYALTHNVPEDFWNEWVKAHADFAFVKNGMVFADKVVKNVDAIAKERKSEKTGFEFLDPKAKQENVEPFKAD